MKTVMNTDMKIIRPQSAHAEMLIQEWHMMGTAHSQRLSLFTQSFCIQVSFEIAEKHVEKGDKKAGYQHFLLSPQCFQKPFLKLRIFKKLDQLHQMLNL